MGTPNDFLFPTHSPRYSSFGLNSAASTEHVEAAAVRAFHLAVKLNMNGKANSFRSSLETAEEVGGFSTNYCINLKGLLCHGRFAYRSVTCNQ